MTAKSVLNKTYIEAFFFALMVATSESYALLYFTRQGLGPLEVALMSTLPLLLGAFSQIWIPKILPERALGTGVLASIFTQIVGLGFLVYCTLLPEMNFPLIVAGLSLYWIGGQTCAPLWLDWVGQLTGNQADFSEYLSKRNKLTTIMIMVLYFSFSLLIDSEFQFPFFALFIVGLTARVISFAWQFYLHQKSKPHLRYQKRKQASTEPEVTEVFDYESLKPLKYFFLWTSLFRFTVNLSGPFFLPYMVNELKLTTIHYVFLTSIPFLGRALFVNNWGRASSGLKSFWGIQIALVFISIIPLLWTFNSSLPYLAGLEFFSGIFWGGFELTSILMVQSLAKNHMRRYLGFHMALMTIFSVAGAMLGGMILKMGVDYHQLFVFSSVARLCVAIGLILSARQFSELKLTKLAAIPYLTSVLSLRPSMSNIGRILLGKAP